MKNQKVLRSIKNKSFFSSLCVLCVLCGQSRAQDHSKFDTILKAAVKDERVDYPLIKAQYYSQLQAYLDMLAEAKPSAVPREDQLAYYINLYNATMIKVVIDRDPAKFKPSDNDYAVFKDKIVRTEGKTISLNELENDIVRKQYNDPRIHAALVCAALSCPPILNRAYRGDDLDAVLTENVKRWLSDPNRNEIDTAGRKLKLSKIFDWYNPDFGGPGKVAEFVAKYTGKDVGGYAVEFKEYDWTLNKTK